MSKFEHEKSWSHTNCHKINGVPQKDCKYVLWLQTELAEAKAEIGRPREVRERKLLMCPNCGDVIKLTERSKHLR